MAKKREQFSIMLRKKARGKLLMEKRKRMADSPSNVEYVNDNRGTNNSDPFHPSYLKIPTHELDHKVN